MSGQIKFAIGEKTAVMWLTHGNSLTRVKNFAYGIAKYTNAEIQRAWCTVGSQMSVNPKDGNTQSLQHSMMNFLRSEDDGRLYGVKILSPNFSQCFDENQETLIASGEEVAELYSALAGSTFTFEHGGLQGPDWPIT